MKIKIQKALAALIICLSLSLSVSAGCPGDIPMPCRMVQQSQPTDDKPNFLEVIIKTMTDWF